MTGLLGGLANVAAKGAAAYGEQTDENTRRLIIEKARQAALARQARQDELANEDRLYKRERDTVEDVARGITPARTRVTTTQAGPVAKQPMFDEKKLTAGVDPTSPLTDEIEEGSLGTIPHVSVESSGPTLDPANSVEGRREAARLAREQAERELHIKSLVGTKLPNGTTIDETMAKAMVDIPGMVGVMTREDPLEVHKKQRVFDQEHPLRDATAAGDAKKTQQSIALQGHFNGDQTFKDAQQVATAYQKIKGAATGEHTATSDMSLIYGLMKMQDPGSTVREGEYATAEKAKGVPDYVRNLYNKAMDGAKLSETQRRQFLETATQIANAQRSVFKGTLSRYSDLATRRGVDPRDVVFDPFEGLIEDAAPAGAPAAAAPAAKAKGAARPPTNAERARASSDPEYKQFLIETKGVRF